MSEVIRPGTATRLGIRRPRRTVHPRTVDHAAWRAYALSVYLNGAPTYVFIPRPARLIVTSVGG